MTINELKKLLYDNCDDETIFDPDVDLIDSGIMDSLVIIELLTRLEDQGIVIQLTQIDRNQLRTISGILKLINSINKE